MQNITVEHSTVIVYTSITGPLRMDTRYNVAKIWTKQPGSNRAR